MTKTEQNAEAWRIVKALVKAAHHNPGGEIEFVVPMSEETKIVSRARRLLAAQKKGRKP